MINTILGIKKDMTQVFDGLGRRRVATKIQAGPCQVVQIKSVDQDGYLAVQLGFGTKKKQTKARTGHLKKAGLSQPVRYLQEIRLVDEPTLNPGDTVAAGDVLEPGDIVKVTGVTKGKGFAGVVKRWGFHGGPKTHGQSDRHRAPGSIGAGTTPGRVLKGKKMAGRMGGDTMSISGLTVLEIDPQTHTILVSGPVPGSTSGLVTVTKTGKKKNFPGMWVNSTEPAPELDTVEEPSVTSESPVDESPSDQVSPAEPAAETAAAADSESTTPSSEPEPKPEPQA